MRYCSSSWTEEFQIADAPNSKKKAPTAISFRVPGGPYIVPIGGVLTSGLLMCTATPHTLVRLFAWMALGLLVYALYGYRHSRLAAGLP
jgi:APA family basic amino acid/polyamine antiporter